MRRMGPPSMSNGHYGHSIMMGHDKKIHTVYCTGMM